MSQSVPHQIGRYEVVARLAMGGMAEILLGRLTGPSGFERTVVIKRILPNFAQDTLFVNMFLDEARIAAGIVHPNVVQHFELGRDGDDLFLVMEYLEGETLSSLTRRARSRGRKLDMDLCAYIVAEACAGLHAAHELEGSDGLPQELVHRDVSPQNVFLTYAGGVKILDFGIAKAADRITQTEAGKLKGKFGYMSPEQVRGERLDRRSDVYALGVVLYELTTQVFLFKRRSRAATLKAVLTQKVVRPSDLIDSYPPRLDEICMRALAPNQNERYQSAAEMRRDLLEAVRDLGTDAMLEEALAKVMHALFEERLKSKHTMLQRVVSGGSLSDIPSPEVDESVEFPEAEYLHPTGELLVTPEGVVVEKSKTDFSVTKLLSIGGVVVLTTILVAGLIGWATTRGSGEEPLQSNPAAIESIESERGEEVTQVVTTAPIEPVPVLVTVSIDSSPEKATVLVGGDKRGETPLDVELARGESPISITIRRDGYTEVAEEIVPTVNQRLRVHLEPERAKRRGTPSGHKTTQQEPQTSKQRGFRRFD